MPPAKRTISKMPMIDAETGEDVNPHNQPEPKGFFEVGKLINIDRGGRTLQNLEVLAVDSTFIKVRWDQQISPLTEVVLIPIAECVIGLVGER